MNTGHFNEPLSPQAYATLLDAAKAQALVLRAEAINAFWARLAAGLRSAGHTLRRGAPRPPVRVTTEASACPR
ncbi:MAG: hypothetical protein ABL916_12725 [Burkholderiaceae bacterium]